MKPRGSTPHQAETIAPTPPRANRSSQLIRVCVPEPSKLSNRPEMLDLSSRFGEFEVPERQRGEEWIGAHVNGGGSYTLRISRTISSRDAKRLGS